MDRVRTNTSVQVSNWYDPVTVVPTGTVGSDINDPDSVRRNRGPTDNDVGTARVGTEVYG